MIPYIYTDRASEDEGYFFLMLTCLLVIEFKWLQKGGQINTVQTYLIFPNIIEIKTLYIFFFLVILAD